MVQRATVSSRLLGNYLRAMGTSILAIPTDLPHSLHQSMDTLKLCSYCWTTVLIRATTTSEIALHCATAFGDYSEAAGILLDLNLDESSQNNNGSTPLHRGAQGSLRVKRTGSSCWTTVQIVTDVVRESVSAGPTCVCVCYVFTVSCPLPPFLYSTQLPTQRSFIYFYTETIIRASHILSLPILPHFRSPQPQSTNP